MIIRRSYVDLNVHMYVCLYVRKYDIQKHIYMYDSECVSIFIYVYVCMYICMHACIYIVI